MSRQLEIVCHAFPAWQGNYMKSTVQLMQELALHHKVLYIDYAYTLKDVMLHAQFETPIPVKNILNTCNSIRKVSLQNGATMHVLSLPPQLPANWISNHHLYQCVQKLNSIPSKFRIRRAIKKLGMKKPLVLNAFNPMNSDLSFNIHPQSATLYYCYDNIAAANWASRHGERMEQQFLKKVNAAIFSSDSLQQMKGRSLKNSYVVKNGVDLSLFETHMNQAFNPNTNSNIQIGYIGTVDDRIDFNIIDQLISKHPHWTLHFIGRIQTQLVEQYKSSPSVIFHGAVEPNLLAEKMKAFNAGIIPFVKNEFTKTIYPMKANEYLAMGLPVVMTDFATLHDLNGQVHVSSPENFVEALAEEIAIDDADKRTQRMQFAVGNSWKHKALELEKILAQYA